MVQKERITFETQDGVRIVGNFFQGRTSGAPAVLLLHMMPALKESWDEFAGKLAAASKEASLALGGRDAGFQVLAIDLRGHGESTSIKDGRTLDFSIFSDKEHQDSILDVEAGREWLMKKGVPAEKIFIGGASIGANLALQYVAEHSEAPAAFLLSPGLDYMDIKTDLLMQGLKENQKVFLAAAEDDLYSAQTVNTLNEIGKSQKILKLYISGGHGTSLFSSRPELMEEIINWLKQ